MVSSHLPIAADVVRIEAWYDVAGQRAVNVYHVLGFQSWSIERLQACASAITTWEQERAFRYRGNQACLIEVSVTDLTSPTSGRWVQAVEPPICGQIDAELLPGNVTLAVQGVTGTRGTGRQARTYWIGLTEAQVTGSNIDPTGALDIGQALSALINYFVDLLNATLCVLHRTQDGVQLDPAVPEAIVSFTARDLTTDSQRSRLPDHKRSR